MPLGHSILHPKIACCPFIFQLIATLPLVKKLTVQPCFTFCPNSCFLAWPVILSLTLLPAVELWKANGSPIIPVYWPEGGLPWALAVTGLIRFVWEYLVNDWPPSPFAIQTTKSEEELAGQASILSSVACA